MLSIEHIINRTIRRIVMTDKAKLEYIWLDGNEPTQTLRSKTMIQSDFSGNLEDCKQWSFDGELDTTGRRK